MPTKRPKQPQYQETEEQAGYPQEPEPTVQQEAQYQEAEEWAGYPQESPPTPQQAAIDEIKSLFQAATKQIREAPLPPTLVGEALEAARLYEDIKRALMKPTEGSPLPLNQRWNLPELNE